MTHGGGPLGPEENHETPTKLEAILMRDGRLLYPVVGIGSFIAMFCLGVTVAYGSDLPAAIVVLIGIVAGCAGASLIARLERSDRES